MDFTRFVLKLTFVMSLSVALVLVLLFETDLLPCGILRSLGGSSEFVVATFMELLTLCFIPLALRLFRFGWVDKRLVSAEALIKFGLTRMLMLCVPMVVNTLLYYLYMNVAFGYMAIILFLCLAFVLPTKSRCESEVKETDE